MTSMLRNEIISQLNTNSTLLSIIVGSPFMVGVNTEFLKDTIKNNRELIRKLEELNEVEL